MFVGLQQPQKPSIFTERCPHQNSRWPSDVYVSIRFRPGSATPDASTTRSADGAEHFASLAARISGVAIDLSVTATDSAGRERATQSRALAVTRTRSWTQAGQLAGTVLGAATGSYTYSSVSGRKLGETRHLALGGFALFNLISRRPFARRRWLALVVASLPALLAPAVIRATTLPAVFRVNVPEVAAYIRLMEGKLLFQGSFYIDDPGLVAHPLILLSFAALLLWITRLRSDLRAQFLLAGAGLV